MIEFGKIARAIGVCALAASAPGHAANGVVLAPASKWSVDYADDACRLMRTFGPDERKTALVLERFAPGHVLVLVVAGPPLRGARGEVAKFRFGPGQPEAEHPVMHGKLADFAPALIASSIRLSEEGEDDRDETWDELEPARTFADLASEEQQVARGISWLLVKASGHDEVRLELGDMAAPMAALDSCTRELIAHWGIDAERHAPLSRRASPASNPGNWLTYRDYPVHMLRAGMEGLVQFRLMVDESGKATSCHIQSSTRPQEFDDAVCKGLLRRAKFKPALDASGAALASYFRSSVRFELP